MVREVKVAIIGAGTAGLSAFKEASKYTDDIVIIDHGPLGTTCARVGCMPSKVLIQAADSFHERLYFDLQGINGAEKLTVDLPKVLQHVRDLRDRFTSGVVKYTKSLDKKFICGHAKFIDADPNMLQVNDEKIKAEKIIIATGSNSIIPDSWDAFKECILTSETIFEQKDFNGSVGVIGAGIIGLEIGQALSRLGVKVCVFHAGNFIAGLTDPAVNQVAIKVLADEFPLNLNERASVKTMKDGALTISTSSYSDKVTHIFAAMGREPNLKSLGLEQFNLELDEHGIPLYDCTTLQIKDSPFFIAGDVNKTRPLLHEAADEGRIAGFNAAQENLQCFHRRLPLKIVFTQPNIAVVGKSYQELQDQSIAIGEIDYSDQGRSRIMNHNRGLLRIYADKKEGRLLGAEMMAPRAEHMAHTLAWAMQKNMTVFEALQMPFYHPVVEEGMRTALRDLSQRIESKVKPFELATCDSAAVETLA